MDSWRVTPELTINYGLRWDTTFGLFQASGVSQFYNPAVQTIRGLQLPLPTVYPMTTARPLHRAWALPTRPTGLKTWSFAPASACTITIWRRTAGRLHSRRSTRPQRFSPAPTRAIPAACRVQPTAARSVIDPNYHTPYALHVSGGVQYALQKNWTLSGDYVHEQGDARLPAV